MNMKFFGETGHRAVPSLNVFWSACIGLAVGALISVVTAYYTSLGKKPVNNIVQNSSTGAGTNIIAGLAVGMKSTFLSVRSEEHTSELQSRPHLVCRLLL